MHKLSTHPLPAKARRSRDAYTKLSYYTVSRIFFYKRYQRRIDFIALSCYSEIIYSSNLMLSLLCWGVSVVSRYTGCLATQGRTLRGKFHEDFHKKLKSPVAVITEIWAWSVAALFDPSLPHCAAASAALPLDTSGMLSLHNRDIAIDMSKSHNTLGTLYDPEVLATSRHVDRLLCESEGRVSHRNWKKWNAPAVS
jgi:hypothetical protein